MFDDLLRLHENPHLLDLLSHYADLGKDDRAIWQNRVMQLEGVEIKDLSKLHGELIAFDWIEQNTGQASVIIEGVISACYRITVHGLREIGRLKGIDYAEKSPETNDKAIPKITRKKKPKSDAIEVLEFATSE